MPGSHLITGNRIVGQFGVPWRGINQLLRPDALPPDALRDASNVLPREGTLRTRPGYQQFHASAFTGTPTGLFHYLRGAADPVPILGTTSKIYKYDSGAWTEISGTNPTATNLQVARFTTIALGSPPTNYVIHTNGKDAPRWWGGSGSFATLSGSPPLWSDVCTIADHVIGIVPPYKVQWGNIRAIDTWPALNTKLAAETADAVVALRPLGQANAAVLYKDRSLWGVSYTGGQTEATAFRFDPIGFYDGPASPAAVVDYDGRHIYMTPTGRIAVFTGSQHDWIADGLWPVIRADFDTTKAMRCWGFYDCVNHEVHFFYPSLTTSSAVRGWVGITLPEPDQGISSFGAFRGFTTGELSAGARIRLTDNVDFLMVAGTTANKSYKFTDAVSTDDTTGFSGYWQTGLQPMPNLDPLRLEGHEVFAERANGYGALNLRTVYSNTLAGDGTLASTAWPVVLSETTEPVYAAAGVDNAARFFGQRYDFTDSSALTLRWKGSTMVAVRGAK